MGKLLGPRRSRGFGAVANRAVPQELRVRHRGYAGSVGADHGGQSPSPCRLCSEADAFVAVSFTAFPLGSQLAFLVAGPMFDTKLAVLYGATFRRRLHRPAGAGGGARHSGRIPRFRHADVTLDARNLRILVLSSWCAFLAWLWLTGETLRYLGPRTQWLVPFGALTLAAATLSYARATGSQAPRSRPSFRETAGLAALLLPIVAGTLLANTQLGALAASKKVTARGIDPSALAELASRNAAQLSFLEVDVAGHNTKFARESGIEPGRPARLVGFVLRDFEIRERIV